eukprot:2398736-Rhodomonas_salina.2
MSGDAPKGEPPLSSSSLCRPSAVAFSLLSRSHSACSRSLSRSSRSLSRSSRSLSRSSRSLTSCRRTPLSQDRTPRSAYTQHILSQYRTARSGDTHATSGRDRSVPDIA